MYKLKPFQENLEIKEKPKCIYNMKSYYEQSASVNNNTNDSARLKQLLERQNKVLEALSSLENRVDALFNSNKNSAPRSSVGNNTKSESLDLGTILRNSNQTVQKTKVQVNKIVSDFVVHADPRQIPYSVFVVLSKLSSKFKCFLQFFTNSSVINNSKELTECTRLNELATVLNLNINESRLSYDFGVTIVWTRTFNSQVMIHSNVKDQPSIVGESAVLRFFTSLFNKSTNVLVDDSVDHLTNEVRQNNDQNRLKKFLENLDNNLKNSKWVSGTNSSTLADVYYWSVLNQNQLNKRLSSYSNVQKWFNSNVVGEYLKSN